MNASLKNTSKTGKIAYLNHPGMAENRSGFDQILHQKPLCPGHILLEADGDLGWLSWPGKIQVEEILKLETKVT